MLSQASQGHSTTQRPVAGPEVVLFLHSAFSLIPADKHCEWKTAKNCIEWETKAFWKLAFAKRETATLALTLTLTLTSALSFYSVIWIYKRPNEFFEQLWARL